MQVKIEVFRHQETQVQTVISGTPEQAEQLLSILYSAFPYVKTLDRLLDRNEVESAKRQAEKWVR